MAGIFSTHIANTMGTEATDMAADEARALFTEGVALLGDNFDKRASDSPFAAREMAQQFLAQVKAGTAQIHFPNNGSGPATTAPAAALGGGTPSSETIATNTEPSEAEKLGTALLKLHGGDTKEAGDTVTFIGNAMAGGSNVLRLLAQTVNAVGRDTHPEDVVRESGRLMLASDRDTLRKSEEYERVFYDLLNAVHGATVPVGTSSILLADAKKEIKDLRSKPAATSPDTFLDAVKDATKVAPKNGETFENYMARVVVEINKAALGTSDNSYTKLLDEVGTKVETPRNTGESNDDYRVRLLNRVESAGKTEKVYWTNHTKLVKFATLNGVTLVDPDKLTPITILRELFGHTVVTPGRLGRSNGTHKLIFPEKTS